MERKESEFTDKYGNVIKDGAELVYDYETWVVQSTNDENNPWILHPCGINSSSEDITITHAIASKCDITKYN